jgi:hypothetical protein
VGQVICLHGDASFGQKCDGVRPWVRYELALLCIISLKGGWTADPERNKPGRDRGYKMAAALGCYAESCRLSRGASRVEEGR